MKSTICKFATGNAIAILAPGFAPVFAQANPASDIRNQVSLSASASVEVQQDLLTMTLTAVKDGTEPAAVQEQLRVALEAALSGARKSALSGAMDVRTGGINLRPRYGRDGKLAGWTGSAELVLEGRDFARIASATSMTISNTYFGLSRESRLKAQNEVQSVAIERFKARASEIAKAFSFAGYAIREVTVSGDDFGAGTARPRMMAMSAAPMAADAVAMPVEAGKSAVAVSVTGSVLLK